MCSIMVPYFDFWRITRRNNHFLCEIGFSRMLLDHNCYEIRIILCHIPTVDTDDRIIAAYVARSSSVTSSTVEIGS